MNMFSFSNGTTTTIDISNQKTPREVVQPYIQDLRFNKIVENKRNNDPSTIIYSIDHVEFLKSLKNDQLEDLSKITLACRPTRDGVGIWDTLFNSNNRQAITACILTAQHDFSPIPQNRVVVTSQFLNFSMTVSRIHLSQVVKGDRVGIAINDMIRQITYVLFYIVEDKCVVRSNIEDVDEIKTVVPAVNLRMEHAVRSDYEGNATIVSVNEESSFNDNAIPFMTWLMDTVYDIPGSYSWKPHFLPLFVKSFERDTIEDRLVAENTNASIVSYTEFENKCRKLYRQAKQNRNIKTREQSDTNRSPIKLPIIEVVSFEDNYQVKLDDDRGSVFIFQKDSLGNQLFTETFLTNQDIKGVVIDESSKLFILSPSKFGENVYLRYFTLNF